MLKTNKLRIGTCLATAIILFGIISTSYANAQTTTVDDELIVSQEAHDLGIWTDQQWRFYKLVLNLNQAVELNVSYSGQLDIDLRIYVDVNPQHGTNEQDMLAWDVTGMGLRPEITPMRNSQIRGTTDVVEEIYYKNERFAQRNVYVLVFSYDGLGSSEFDLNSNVSVSTVPNNALVKSEIITTATIIFAGTMVGATLVAIITAKFLELPKKERKLRKLEKQKEKQQKKLQKEKMKAAKQSKKQKQISMKKRRRSGRRR